MKLAVARPTSGFQADLWRLNERMAAAISECHDAVLARESWTVEMVVTMLSDVLHAGASGCVAAGFTRDDYLSLAEMAWQSALESHRAAEAEEGN